MASQYTEMFQDIDEVKMDHLTFFRIFHSLSQFEEQTRFDTAVEWDVYQAATIMNVAYH